MNILVGNIGSTSLKSKLIRFTAHNIAELLGEANLDKIKSKDASTFSFRLAGGEKQKKPATVFGLKKGIEYLGISAAEAQDMLSFNSGLKSMAGLGTEDCKTIETLIPGWVKLHNRNGGFFSLYKKLEYVQEDYNQDFNDAIVNLQLSGLKIFIHIY